MMTPSQTAYRAGQIAGAVDLSLAGQRGLSPALLGNISRLPGKLPIWLRHLWDRTARDPILAVLLETWEPSQVPATVAEQSSFWLSYYHQRHLMRAASA